MSNTAQHHTIGNTRITEAIVLAGGLGTRLREAVPDLPKCMAPVADKPFLSYVINALRMQGVQHFVFSLGYKWEVIDAYMKEFYPTLQYQIVVEKEPLGTGGAIQLSLQKCKTNDVLIANGDTLFKINLQTMAQTHFSNHSSCTLALKPMQQFDRYGAVQVSENGLIASFREKQFFAEGLINGGIYLLNKQALLQKKLPQKFSFEKDFLEAYTAENRFYGSVQQGYFIDIGIPEDFNKAQKELAKPELDLTAVDKSWTIFLDRDGVINEELPGTYVMNWQQFQFSEGALEAIKVLAQKAGKIIVVSNQRGVGRGLMTENDLQAIHSEMKREVEDYGGRIDAIFYCTEKDATCFYRKPNPGMALQAFAEFNDIDKNRCIMVGNKPGDMQFGRAAGMHTVFISSTNPQQTYPHPDIDLLFPSLSAFAQALQS